MSTSNALNTINPEAPLWRAESEALFSPPQQRLEGTEWEANYLLPHIVTGPENLQTSTATIDAWRWVTD